MTSITTAVQGARRQTVRVAGEACIAGLLGVVCALIIALGVALCAAPFTVGEAHGIAAGFALGILEVAGLVAVGFIVSLVRRIKHPERY